MQSVVTGQDPTTLERKNTSASKQLRQKIIHTITGTNRIPQTKIKKMRSACVRINVSMYVMVIVPCQLPLPPVFCHLSSMEWIVTMFIKERTTKPPVAITSDQPIRSFISLQSMCWLVWCRRRCKTQPGNFLILSSGGPGPEQKQTKKKMKNSQGFLHRHFRYGSLEISKLWFIFCPMKCLPQRRHHVRYW